MLKPEWYTKTEGGEWILFDVDVWNSLDFRLLKQRSKSSVKIKDKNVHSLAFDNPACGNENFLRWDCINGFNQ